VEAAIDKPVVAYIAGQHAPTLDSHFGHAGEIVDARLSGIYKRIDDLTIGTAQRKIEAFESAGIRVARRPSDIPEQVRQVLSGVST
jgi:succinyl-CoA synthetase alpha subunit